MSDRWTWIVVAALVAAAWWWRKRAAPGPAVGTSAPAMSTVGVVATLQTERDPRACGPNSSRMCGLMLPPAKPLDMVGLGRTAPPALMNAPAPAGPSPTAQRTAAYVPGRV